MERKVPVLTGLTEESSQEERATAAFETIYKIRNVTVSTVDRDLPASRVFDMALLEDGNIYFCTATGKPAYKQLQKRPYIVITT